MNARRDVLQPKSEKRGSFYRLFLLFIAGMGGLLYGIDIGIIAAALLYLGKTIELTLAQKSIIVAAVLGGGMISSPFAGILADWFGRKKVMVLSGLLFVISVVLIVASQGFLSLFLGRLLQGMSTGVIAVVVPLYLAETLSAHLRGRGTAIFQFMLTFGIVVASLIGFYYTHQAQAAIAQAGHNAARILAAENHAWRGMFFAILYPGLIFFAGSFFLGESPRWLFRHGRSEDALRILSRSSSPEEAAMELAEMQTLSSEYGEPRLRSESGSLLRRKYVIPFLVACVILTCNQTTGINSVLSFLVVILNRAGLSPTLATQGDVLVKVLNCVMTIVAVALVDRKGRKFLLKVGTAGIILSLLAGSAVFYSFESKAVNVKDIVIAAAQKDRVTLPVNASTMHVSTGTRPGSLTVLYTYGNGDHMATVLSNSADPVLKIAPEGKSPAGVLHIKRASYGAVPPESVGWVVALCLAIFIACFAVGPGVVVWLTLSELMPTRIRSVGMGIALLFNQGASTLIAALFLPVVGHYGYAAMFLFWAASTVIYFVTASFFLPETKGKTLEEIELYFEGARG
uniref:MFS transporter n=1 Tax=Acidobacterium capsulatum TaxID=33075 RepID=A0A7V4XQ33_9BACT